MSKKLIHVLIADDHQLFREGMEGLLRKIPIIGDIHHATNGQEAITLLRKHPCRLIFMDIRMPVLDGIETTRVLVNQKTTARIIALTMMEDSHSVVSMLRAGASGYLLKNTSFAELEEAVTQVLAGNRYFSKNLAENVLTAIVGHDPPHTPKPDTPLSSREMEIISFICRGFNSKQVAEILDIAPKTVESHRANIYSKLGIANIADLVFYALQKGLVIRP